MAVQTTAGSTFAISAGAPATLDASGYNALTYTVVGEVTDIGEVGREYNLVNHNPIASRKTQKLKGSYDPGTINLQFGRDFADAGQTLMRTASLDDNTYSVRITLQNGKKLYFRALVTTFKTNLGNVDSITGGTADLSLMEDVLEV